MPPIRLVLFVIQALVYDGDSFHQTHSYRSAYRLTPSACRLTPSLLAVKTSPLASSFQQARLAEQLRLSKQQTHHEDITADMSTEKNDSTDGSNEGDAAASSSEEAWHSLETERDELGPDGLPFAPMMTYEKYLTMQVCVLLFEFDKSL